MPKNFISVIKTVDNLQTPEGPLVAIMIGANVHDAASADTFIAELVEEFKAQRMMSSPDTNGLLVTLVGDLSAARFAERWRALAVGDAILGIFMSQMRRADVVRAAGADTAPETVSLLCGPT